MSSQALKVSGPFKDPDKKGQPKEWYLRYRAPVLGTNGSPLLDSTGKVLLKRHRPYYASKALAEADRHRILAQFRVSGPGAFVQSRAAAEEFEQAKLIVPEVSLVELAKFYRLHHPRHDVRKIEEWIPLFLDDVKRRLGETRHWEDLKSRLNGPFGKLFGGRIPETVTRKEFMDFLMSLGKSGRTVLNTKRAACNFFSYLGEQGAVTHNPAGGIKKRQLPRIVSKEIRFLSIDEAERYLRAAEHYDPELVAHEVVQLIAGVRADDEMANFDGSWVHPETKEVVIPANVAKTGQREVINELEDNFWAWWAAYGRTGLLRPRNYSNRWDRLRILAWISDKAEADRSAKLPIKTLRAGNGFREVLKSWPWNGRRRTFCTYHVAKHQSADKTALIMRHRGDTYTLHESYRGLGVTQAMGNAYFQIQPRPVAKPITPEFKPTGIVLRQMQRRSVSETTV